MTGADDGAGPGVRPMRRWDVALSFAGAQRDYVGQVARALTAWGVRCFYDADEEIDLWGKFLPEELPAIYGEQAAAVVVVFVSAEYATRDWTRVERRSALDRAVRERREYVLPARFDDTPLPGLLPSVSYVDLRKKTPQQFAAMIAAKLADLGVTEPPSRLARTLGGHEGPVCVAFSPDGRLLATAGKDGTARLWNPATGEHRRTLTGHESSEFDVGEFPGLSDHWTDGGGVNWLAFSPDGRLLATASGDRTARLWDPATGEHRRTLTGHTRDLWDVAFSPDGRLLATGGEDGTARLWDPATGEHRRTLTLTGHTVSETRVAFSPDGRLLATASGWTVQLWDPTTGQSVGSPVRTGDVTRMGFSPDGRLLATASGWTVQLWDPATGELRRALDTHNLVTGMAFSPAGWLLATGSPRGVGLWDPATGQHRRTLRGHLAASSVTGVAFSPDGRLLATADDSGCTLLWN
jgi:WD40 repeat protein